MMHGHRVGAFALALLLLLASVAVASTCSCPTGEAASGADCPAPSLRMDRRQNYEVCVSGLLRESQQDFRSPVQCGGTQKQFDNVEHDCSSQGIGKQCTVSRHRYADGFEFETCVQYCNDQGLECLAAYKPEADGVCTPKSLEMRGRISCYADMFAFPGKIADDIPQGSICQCGPNAPANDVYLKNFAGADLVRVGNFPRSRDEYDIWDQRDDQLRIGECRLDELVNGPERTWFRVYACDEAAQTLVVDFDCDSATCENCNQKKQIVGRDSSDGTQTRFTFGHNLTDIQCPVTDEFPPTACVTIGGAGDDSYNGEYCPTSSGAKVNGKPQFQHAVQGSSRQLTWDGNNWLLGPRGSKAKFVSNAPFPWVRNGWAYNDFAVNHRIQACIDSCSGVACALCHDEAPSDAYPVPHALGGSVFFAPKEHFSSNYKSCTIGTFDFFMYGDYHRSNSRRARLVVIGEGQWEWTQENDETLYQWVDKTPPYTLYLHFKPGQLPCETLDEANSDCVGKDKLVLCGTPESRPVFGPPTMGACSNHGLNAHCDACTGPSPSQCVLVTCDSGFFDTDGQASNGCERNAGGVLQTAAPVVVETAAPSVAKANRDAGRVRRVKFRATIKLPNQADKQAKIGQRIARDLQAELRKTSPKLLVRFIEWTLATTRRRLLADAAEYDAQLEFDSTATDTTAADAVADFSKRLATTADAQTLSDLLTDSVHAVDPTVEFKIAEQKIPDGITDDSGSSDSSGFSTGAIAGIIGGAVVAVAVIVGVVVARNKNKNKQNSNENKAAPAGQQTTAKSNHTAAADTSIEIRGAGNEKSSE